MKTLESMLRSTPGIGMPDKGDKLCYFAICDPSKDYPNRYLIITMTDLPKLQYTKYKVCDRWKKKYPDDNPTDWDPWIVVNPLWNPDDVKKLKKIGDLIKKGKSDVVTLHSILFSMGHPERQLDYIYNEMKKRGRGARD